MTVRKKRKKKSMKAVLLELCNYIEKELIKGTRLNEITRHILGAFNGVPGARNFRQILSVNALKSGAGVDVLTNAIDMVSDKKIR